MTVVSCSLPERFVNPLFEVFEGGDFVLTSYRDIEREDTELRIYFPDPADAPAAIAALEAAAGIVGARIECETRTFPDEDWKLSYRKHFKVEVISPRLAIVPEWEKDVWLAAHPGDDAPKAIYLDPGLAFGTGQHATTRACLAYTDRLAAANPDRSYLDVGCGSGILALSACRCGFREVAGFDIDPDAVAAANENAVKNGIAPVFMRGDLCNKSTLPEVARTGGRSFDVVAANVLGPILIRFAGEIAALVAPHGELILSGILDEIYPEVREAYERRGFVEKDSTLIGEWRTGLMTRP